ncbi:hypothetical protein DPMN_112335 [Dreissena polymorpha]|uniref:Uncharacterized protein n=1 Tax=Dreissena polymorpha TaxID=45954 RepID=A0A9D4QPX0_DREPO|nr:hypothetical protein DPMN_112335 [Dreissena polymorpha]
MTKKFHDYLYVAEDNDGLLLQSETIADIPLHRAKDNTFQNAEKSKRVCDANARATKIVPGDLGLVRNVAQRGKKKIADKSEDVPYVVIDQPNTKIPVYAVRKKPTLLLIYTLCSWKLVSAVKNNRTASTLKAKSFDVRYTTTTARLT